MSSDNGPVGASGACEDRYSRKGIRALQAAVRNLDTTVSPQLARSIQAAENHVRDIDREFGLLSAMQVSVLLGNRAGDARSVNRMRAAGKVLGIRRGNRFLYQGFQFAGSSVKPVIPRLLEAGRAAEWDDSDVVLWLCSPTTYLPGGHRPVDFLNDADTVVAAAQASFNVEW
jgi:hypothetical protein